MLGQKRGLKVVAFLTALMLVSTALTFAAPFDEYDDLKKRLEETESKKAEHERQLENNKSQQRDLIQQIAEVDRRLVAATAEANRLSRELDAVVAQRQAAEQELAKAQAALNLTQRQLEDAKRRLAKYKAILNDRVTSVYKNGKANYIQVLFKSSDFADLLNRLSFLRLILEQDSRLVRESKSAKEAVEKKEAEQLKIKQTIELKKAAIVAEEERISFLKTEQDMQRNAAQAELAQRNVLSEQLKKDEAALEEMIRREEADAAALADRIRSWDDVFVSRTGWVWPVGSPADITSPYGWRVHPVTGKPSFHTGVDIAVPYGTPVVAANNGVVADARWFGAYGLYVGINHGEGMASAYGHFSSIAVEVGQKVKAGEVIGYVGSTGLSTGPHVHFEILIDGAQQDPMQWY